MGTSDREQVEADGGLLQSVDRFEAPPSPAGEAAAEWLKQSALERTGHITTYVLIGGDRVLAFYSLGMGEVELRTQHRKKIGGRHPRVGAVVVL